MSFGDKKELFKELPFYNTPIKKPYMKCLNDIDLLRELPFHNESSIVKTSKRFRGYEKSYKIEIIGSKASVQLTASIQSIKGLFDDLLNEIKGFKYQITMTFLLKNIKKIEI